MAEPTSEHVRIDTWLWAARLFKSRGLAVEAVKDGRVQVGGARTKPGRTMRVGERVEVRAGQRRTELVVQALSTRRGPASEAAALYEETAESRAAREALAAQRAAEGGPGLGSPRAGARPTKRDRRRLEGGRGR